MSQATAIVRSFLARLADDDAGANEVFVEYLVGALSDEDAELDVVDEQLCNVCSGYAAMQADSRLCALLETCQAVIAAKTCTSTSTGRQAALSLTAIPSANTTAAVHPSSSEATHKSQPEAQCSSQEPKEPDDSSIDEPVGQLLALCPEGTSHAFVKYLLKIELEGDVQAAANFLLECDNLAQREREHSKRVEAQLLREKEERTLLERSRQQIVARFALQEIKEQPQGAWKGPQPTLLPAGALKEETPKVRYLNGVPVKLRQGEKYVVESVKDDWDGGSRGKVFTKGKRGKGFT